MLALFHLSPVLLVTAMLVVLRRPPVHAALAGTLLVMVLWFAGAADAWRLGSMVAAAQDTAVLFASTAFVIVPGLLFVIFIERMGVNLALSQWVRSLGLGRGDQVVFIVLGLAPLLEAMTGFGVSLIATVPLLLSLFERRVALRIALTGMAIMPWGTLGLATVIGASLVHLDAPALASTSALTSAPVFFALSAIALYLAGVRDAREWRALGAFWLLFVGVLVSAIGVSYSAHWNRQLLNTLYNELSVRDKAQAEWGRLILEQSTWTAHSRIEVLATEQLKMHIPGAADVQMVAP